jgi:hypothetical protein
MKNQRRGAASSAVLSSDGLGDVIAACGFMDAAKNELVLAVLALEECGNFTNTVSAMKESIGDLVVSIKQLDDLIESSNAQGNAPGTALKG